MSNLTKLEFVALDISGKNYLSWVLDAKIHLDVMGLRDTIKENNKASNQENAKAMIFLRHHLDEDLKIEYLTIKDPLVLWKNLKERITSILTLCGEKISDFDKLEKTFSTFHASNVLLQQQYREKDFTKYCDLVAHLLVAEQNNDLLMKNHENRPTGAAPLPEVNGGASIKRKEKNPEANFISENQIDITHLDVADFFEHPEGKIDHLIGDGSVVRDD
ncbi:uncharacterized protein LOC132630452 [Lycium barbarum]|uniref:uncharacterized protein LOC132630452 n=1 Tax=Lycium barbarum TaxID=112863 RepID=UPI00293EFAFD|nr:uncharacterized protein LOC132630452 [Lycium barbarum]